MLTSMLLFSLLLCCDTVLGFQFRAINDKASLDQAAALFLDAGISRSNVMAWVECVERYNGPQRQYARTVMNTNWVSVSDDHRHPSLRSILSFKQEMRSGFNCRTGMFVLIKDSLSARRYEPGGRDSGSEATLRGELDYIAETGLYSLTSDEANVYKALHAGIKLPAVPEVTHARIDEAFRKMKATWQKKGLTFPEGQVKIMQTLAVGKEGQAYSTCSGVAIERPNRFIFVSKLSYFSPYAMIEFGSREEMVEYLFGPPDQMPNNGYGYMILLNDEVVWTCTSKRIANKTSGGDVQ